jgi:hypothetical protein
MYQQLKNTGKIWKGVHCVERCSYRENDIPPTAPGVRISAWYGLADQSKVLLVGVRHREVKHKAVLPTGTILLSKRLHYHRTRHRRMGRVN